MNKNYLGSDIRKLGFGLMRLPQTDGKIDIEQLKQMVDLFLEKGFTYFDTAYPYHGGQSEVAIREALVKRHPRSTYQLATKLPVWEVKQTSDLQRLFDTQLERTGVEYFDFYLLHALGKDRMADLDKFDMWGFVTGLKAKGLVRHAGFSFHDTADVLDEILTKHPEMEFVQLQINYADWEDQGVQSRLCYEVALKHNKPIIVMEPVKGGRLSSMSPAVVSIMKESAPSLSVASWAIRYAASLDNLVTVLSGMSNMEQMKDNLSYMADFKPLNYAEREVLDAVIAKNAEIPTIPCTDCKYCVDDCPQKINIPGIFGTYNDLKIYNNLEAMKGHYGWVTREGGKASDCIACGLCEGHCPQHIPIIENLKEIAGVLEV